ncbi:MAG: sigma factor-like helix-turn-helix DNA-binding protein [Candidatus Bathyarchaeia archaeon]
MAAKEKFCKIVSAVDRLLETKYGLMFNVEDTMEERFSLREKVIDYLNFNPEAAKFLEGSRGREKVDDGLLKTLFNMGYSDREIAAFFNVCMETVMRRRRRIGLVRGRRDPVHVPENIVLPPKVKDVVEAYNMGMSVKEIAAKFNVKANTVRFYTRLARKAEEAGEFYWRKPTRSEDARVKISFYIGSRSRRNGGRLWLQKVFQSHGVAGRKMCFNSVQERNFFLLNLFRGEDVRGARKHALTRWLKEENMFSKDEVERFYWSLFNSSAA